MPELPEVETVRLGLDRQVVGRRIEWVEVGRERTVRRTSRDAIVNGLTGATIVATRRRGKYHLLSLDTGDEVMEGALPLDPPLEVALKVGTDWETMDRYVREAETWRRVPKTAVDVAREEAEEAIAEPLSA